MASSYRDTAFGEAQVAYTDDPGNHTQMQVVNQPGQNLMFQPSTKLTWFSPDVSSIKQLSCLPNQNSATQDAGAVKSPEWKNSEGGNGYGVNNQSLDPQIEFQPTSQLSNKKWDQRTPNAYHDNERSGQEQQSFQGLNDSSLFTKSQHKTAATIDSFQR